MQHLGITVYRMYFAGCFLSVSIFALYFTVNVIKSNIRMFMFILKIDRGFAGERA